MHSRACRLELRFLTADALDTVGCEGQSYLADTLDRQVGDPTILWTEHEGAL
jgi:hypothetical protein